MFDEYTDLVAVFTHYFVYTYCMVLLSGIKNTQSLYTVQNMQGFFYCGELFQCQEEFLITVK